MPLLTIEAGGSPQLEPGVYQAEFMSLSEDENDKGQIYYWRFRLDGGNEVSFISDRKVKATTKAGRWLAALSGQKTPSDGMQVDPDNYIGQRYQLVIAPNSKGTITLQSFFKS